MSFIAILNNFLQCIAQLGDNADCAEHLTSLAYLWKLHTLRQARGIRRQLYILIGAAEMEREPWLNVLSAKMADSTPSVSSLFKAVLALCEKSFEERNANEGLQCDISHISFLDWLQNKKTGLKWKPCGQERESVSLLLAVCVRTRIESHMSCMACGRR